LRSPSNLSVGLVLSASKCVGKRATDAELRDELTYMILAHAIIDQENADKLSATRWASCRENSCYVVNGATGGEE